MKGSPSNNQPPCAVQFYHFRCQWHTWHLYGNVKHIGQNSDLFAHIYWWRAERAEVSFTLLLIPPNSAPTQDHRTTCACFLTCLAGGPSDILGSIPYPQEGVWPASLGGDPRLLGPWTLFSFCDRHEGRLGSGNICRCYHSSPQAPLAVWMTEFG